MRPVNFNNIVDFSLITLLSNPALYTNLRISRDSIPAGYYAYDIRDDGRGNPASVEENVWVNHIGTVVLSSELDFKGKDYIPIRRKKAEDFNYMCQLPSLGPDTPSHVSFSEFEDLLSKEKGNLKEAGK